MPRIIQKMDIDAIKRAAKKPVAGKVTDTLAAVATFMPDVVKLEPGQGVKYAVPANVRPSSYLGQARAKLVSVRREGQPWAGRVYETLLDNDGKVVVYRAADTGIALPVKKGGRKAGTKNLATALKDAQEHLGSTNVQSASNENGAENGENGNGSEQEIQPPVNGNDNGTEKASKGKGTTVIKDLTKKS